MPKREPKTHDYRAGRRGWGHDYNIITGTNRTLRVMGWGLGIEAGDYILLSQPDGTSDTRYKFEDIQYKMDPRDCWSANLSFAPRQNV